MSGERMMAPVTVLALASWLAAAQAAAAPAEVPVEVRFGLVDPDGRPVAGVPVRLAFASGDGWQRAGAGTDATTDAAGEVRWSARTALESRRRKLPTNFFTQLASLPQTTVHFAVAAQLPFLGRSWLYVHEADLFDGGTTVQMDAPRLFGPDARGDFTEPAVPKDGAWRLPGFDLVLTGTSGAPGYRVTRFSIAPGRDGWSVWLVLRREPEPVRR